jgi:hypothetical protein
MGFAKGSTHPTRFKPDIGESNGTMLKTLTLNRRNAAARTGQGGYAQGFYFSVCSHWAAGAGLFNPLRPRLNVAVA